MKTGSLALSVFAKGLMACLAVSSGASLAHASEKESHGGVVVVCRDSVGKVIPDKLELYDIFENKVDRDSPLEFDETLSEAGALAQVAERFKDFPKQQLLFSIYLERVRRNLEIGDHEFKLAPVADLGGSWVPRDCALETAAIYRDTGKILLDPVIWAGLKPLHRAGLLVHEAIYAMARDLSGAETSASSRKMTGNLLALIPDGLAFRRTLARAIPFVERSCVVEPGELDCNSPFEKFILPIDAGKQQLSVVVRSAGAAVLTAMHSTARVFRASNWGEPSGTPWEGSLTQQWAFGRGIKKEISLAGPAELWRGRTLQMVLSSFEGQSIMEYEVRLGGKTIWRGSRWLGGYPDLVDFVSLVIF